MALEKGFMGKTRVYLRQHDKGLKTIAFWSITGLFGIIGAVLGAGTGPAAPVMIPLLMVGFGFLGTLLYAGLTKLFNKIARNDEDSKAPIWPDNYHHTKDHHKKSFGKKIKKGAAHALDAAKSAINTVLSDDDDEELAHEQKQSPDHHKEYIQDGFWSSYNRQMRELMVCTYDSVKGWFKPSEKRDEAKKQEGHSSHSDSEHGHVFHKTAQRYSPTPDPEAAAEAGRRARWAVRNPGPYPEYLETEQKANKKRPDPKA